MRHHLPVPDLPKVEVTPVDEVTEASFDPMKEKPPKIPMICSACGATTNLIKGECPAEGM